MCSSNVSDKVVVVMLVGPSDVEVRRADQVLRSIISCEPLMPYVVLADDSPVERDLRSLLQGLEHLGCTVVHTGASERKHYDFTGNVSEALLRCLLASYSHMPDLDYLIKIDTDALVIRPFLMAILSKFRHHSNVGILGALGCSSNPEERTVEYETFLLDQIVRLGIIHDLNSHGASPGGYIVNWADLPHRRRNQLLQLAEHLSPLFTSAYAGMHPQGGAYAVSGNLVRAMFKYGCFDDPRLWRECNIGDDQMMGAYCHLLNFNSLDDSAEGGVFGVKASGLAYSPDKLWHNGYSIIHSVKNDLLHAESDIVAYFANYR